MSAAPRSSPLRRGRQLALWVLLGALGAALLAATAPLAIGYRSFTMRSGSMTPTLDVGDVVVTEPIAPPAARVGQIVAFPDPEGSGRLFSHRVQSIRTDGDVVHFVTRGDANTSTERWSVPAGGTIGRVVYRVPKIGYALVWTGTPPGRIALIAIPALLLCWTALRWIWRPAGTGEPEAAGGE